MADDLGALVVFAGANVRYLTGSYRVTGNIILIFAMQCFLGKGNLTFLKQPVQTCEMLGFAMDEG